MTLYFSKERDVFLLEDYIHMCVYVCVYVYARRRTYGCGDMCVCVCDVFVMCSLICSGLRV